MGANMAVESLLPHLKLQDLSESIRSGKKVIAPNSLHSWLIAQAANLKSDNQSAPILVVTPGSTLDLQLELHEIAPELIIQTFPNWETLPHERLSPQSDTVAARYKALNMLRTNQPIDILLTPVRALMQPFVKGFGSIAAPKFEAGLQIDMHRCAEELVSLGYARTDLVEKRGEFAIRGGLLDIFPPQEDHPVRVEFFDDTIEEVRTFSIADQRTMALIAGAVVALPSREMALTEDVKKRAAALVEKYPGISDLLGKIATGIAAEGMESLIPALVESMESLTEILPKDSKVILVSPDLINSRAGELISTGREFLEASWLNAAHGNTVPIELGGSSFIELSEVLSELENRNFNIGSVAPFGIDGENSEFAEFEAIEPIRGNIDRFTLQINEKIKEGWRVVIAAIGHGTAERYANLLNDADIPMKLIEDLADPSSNVAHVTTSAIRFGFSAPHEKIFLVTERDFVGAKAVNSEGARLAPRRGKRIDPLALKDGDYVVHEIHGVGRFIEMVERVVGGTTREYLVIEYASSKRGQPADRLYLPTDSLDQITRYVGGEAPSVHRIGGADWQKAKGRAKKAVRQIASELIQLYAARTSSPGFAFSPDTPWQRELEDAFPFSETPDQLSTISDVKADMERPYPMDRIVCGDVGFGKTEVAIRAAFKAVQDGKQVSILCPTTLLVQQHLTTFRERYSGFPIRVEALSRFSTQSEIKKVIADLATGAVDVVIGTHRLLSTDVIFRDLGLMVVDEEQRFGVEHKEILKKFRAHVDVLSMSATPIPRTLEMSITGIREMSIMATPPEERHPILTYVGEYEEKQITAAIRRELLRDGQIFYIHNRVESIDRAVIRLQELVPEARIQIAHGQMSEDALEKVIVSFWEKEFDMLVCTTIVENGIDIPNANTLIVERADLMGLSQLHQLRGRVGRGRERGYAYFLYPTEKPLTETAFDRLATIAANTELGSGMQVALKDLEIRGAGNLLGGEQSGHIADVGFDLYMRMIGEAVSEFRGKKPENVDCKIELPVDAHLPHDYVESERVRLDIYRRLADSKNDAEVDEITAELLDRFGALPEVVSNLMNIAKLRATAKARALREVVMHGKFLRLAPVVLSDSLSVRMDRIYPGHIYKATAETLLLPTPGSRNLANSLTPMAIGNTELLSWVNEALENAAPIK
jgi:transcription-repair coupling factor (superfamily II helicase)